MSLSVRRLIHRYSLNRITEHGLIISRKVEQRTRSDIMPFKSQLVLPYCLDTTYMEDMVTGQLKFSIGGGANCIIIRTTSTQCGEIYYSLR